MLIFSTLTKELSELGAFLVSIVTLASVLVGVEYSKRSNKKLIYEMSPNHGSSMHDKLNSIESRLENDEKTTLQYRQALDKRLSWIESQLQHKNAICKRNKRK